MGLNGLFGIVRFFALKKNFFLGDIKNSLLTKLAQAIRLDTGVDLCISLRFYGQPNNLC